jgi:fibronectin-binding autotransporter adhesin
MQITSHQTSNSPNHSNPMKIISHMTSAKALGVFTLIAVLGLLSLPRAEAATLYWDTGGSSGQWDTATTSLWSASLGGGSKGTWSGLSGTDAVFSATTTTLAQAVTVSGGVTANSIEIKQGTTVSIGGTSTPSITLGAGGITIGSTGGAFQFLSTLGTTATSGVILSASQSWTLNKASGSQIGGSNAASITGAAGTAVTLTIAGTGAGGSTFGGIIRDGTGGGKLAFTYSGAGQISMAGANTYSGNTTLNGTGEVIATVDGVGSSGNATSGAFGAGTVLVNGASAVKMRSTGNGNRTVFNSVTLAGDIQFVTNDKSLTLAGPVTITGSTRTISTDISGNTTATPALGIISGNIGDGSNGFGLTKSGGGMLILTGNNTYSGDTRIGNGTMALGAASGTGTLALQNTTVDLNAADVGTIQFGTSNATTTTSATFGGLKGSRNLALTNAHATPAAVALTVGGNHGNTTYSGNLTGTGGSLTKSGNGTLTLSGTNTYTGTTTVSTGTLLIDGNQSSASGNVSVSAGAILGGNGTIGGAATIAANATLSPGNSPGNLTFSNGLTLAGAYKWELAALSIANPGTDWDRITVTSGNVDITGASMNLTLGGFAPSANVFWTSTQTWTGILNNTGGGSISGAFAAIDNSSWSIYGAFSTVGVDNDVNLVWTAVPEPATWLLAFSGISFVLVARRLRHRC